MTTANSPTLERSSWTEYEQLALDKLERVLGVDRAHSLLEEMLVTRGSSLHSPQDLYDFAQALSARTGFEAAVGAMLGVTAIIRGARPEMPAPPPETLPPIGSAMY